jgi:hypothetical protein
MVADTTPNVPVTPSNSGTQLFGRKYQLIVKTAPDTSGNQTVLTVTDSAFEPEALRMTFEVVTSWWSAPWYANISIYNLNEQTANLLLTQGQNSATPATTAPNATGQTIPIQAGMEVILYAGYQNNNNYGVIWDGYVLQPMWIRENQTDFKLTLHCINWLGLIGRNSIAANPQAGATQQQVVAAIAAQSYHPIGVGQITSQLGNKSLPRGKVMFGSPGKYLNEIARDNNMQWWLSQKGLLNFSGLEEGLSESYNNPQVYTPPGGNRDGVIIGTPSQTQLGVNFRILLDSTVQVKKPAMCVKIDQTQVQQLERTAGVGPGFLSQTGTYVVFGATYRGDTRGQDWYTDVVGLLTTQEATAMGVVPPGVQLTS